MWKEVKVSSVCSAQNGYAFKSKEFSCEGNYYVIKIKELKNGQVLITSDTDKTIYNEKYKKFEIHQGDILFALTGDPTNKQNPLSWVGRVSKYNNKEVSLLNQRVCKILFSDEIDKDYFYYYFRVFKNFRELASKARGSASQANISTYDILNSTIILPPLAIQKKISSTLLSLDKKIGVNYQICANLEAQAQALFKHWFIDFAPFKDGKFVESELGMIPEGWRVGKLGDLTEFLNGFAFKSSSFVSKGKYKVITIKAVQDGKLITDSADEIEDLSLNIPSHCVLKIGDILLSLTGNVGRVCIVTQDNLVLNQRVCILNPRNLIDRGYVYTLSRTKLLKTRMINIAKGTAQANLSPVETSKLSIVVPPRYILDKFGIIANEYMSEIISAYQENQRLSSLRDTLLPKLMSGEIKV